MKLAILGSCTTRDMVQYLPEETHLVFYAARTSFISLLANPVPIEEDEIHVEHAFNRRVVFWDMTKAFWEKLKQAQPDVLIIDFIDERFDLWKKGEQIVTRSNYLQSSGIEKKALGGFDLIRRDSAVAHDLWMHSCELVVPRLRKICNNIIIHRAVWAEKYWIDGESKYFLADERNLATKANQWLNSYYDHFMSLCPDAMEVRVEEKYCVSNYAHKWGHDFFHYIETYYKRLAYLTGSAIQSIHKDRNMPQKKINDFTSKRINQLYLERDLGDVFVYSLKKKDIISSDANATATFSFGNLFSPKAVIEKAEDCCEFIFHPSSPGGYDIRLILSKAQVVTGLGVGLRLESWVGINAISIGFTKNNVVTNIKARKIALNHWFFCEFDFSDIAFKLSNDDWASYPETSIDDIRIFIDGTPAPSGGRVSVDGFYAWRQASPAPDWLDATGVLPDHRLGLVTKSVWDWIDLAYSERKSFDPVRECPLAYGKVNLQWQAWEYQPKLIQESVTYRFSWHAWHPVILSLLEYKKTNRATFRESAIYFASNWISSSYLNVDKDIKYCWYDHGTAERLIAMALLYNLLHEDGHSRFKSTLRFVIYKHAQLIASESFYAYTQNYRYHNHAWFQDLALLICPMLCPWLKCGDAWIELSLSRLEDQISKMATFENEMCLLNENSIGYHDGMITMLKLIDNVLEISGNQSSLVRKACIGFEKFSKYLKYPDGRYPSYGDTHRIPNPAKPSFRGNFDLKSLIFNNAGYACIKGAHENIYFQAFFVASSLCSTHKHEDNLSFSLYFDGVEWLIDPSFYSHDYQHAIPSYLRSALAHNAIAIPGMKYSIEPGLANISGDISEFDQSVSLRMSHDCYSGVRISRSVYCEPQELKINISDSVIPDQDICEEKDVCFMFHCGEGVVAAHDGSNVILSHPYSKHNLVIKSNIGLSPVIKNGEYSNEPSLIRGVASWGLMQASDIFSLEYSRKLEEIHVDFEIFAI